MLNILGLEVGYLEVLVWIVCGLLAFIIARARGAETLTALGWFILGLFVGPLAPIGAVFFARPPKRA